MAPVHTSRRLEKRRRTDRMEQRRDVAHRLGFELARHLRPAAHESERGYGPATVLVAELQAAVDGRARPDVPVDAQDLVVARPVRHHLIGVVVLTRWVGRVRQGKEAEERLSSRVDAMSRDDAVHETSRPTAGDIAVPLTLRVADEDGFAIAADRLREVPVTFERRRHAPQVQRPGIRPAQHVPATRRRTTGCAGG